MDYEKLYSNIKRILELEEEFSKFGRDPENEEYLKKLREYNRLIDNGVRFFSFEDLCSYEKTVQELFLREIDEKLEERHERRTDRLRRIIGKLKDYRDSQEKIFDHRERSDLKNQLLRRLEEKFSSSAYSNIVSIVEDIFI